MNALVETEIGTIAPEWRAAPLECICEPPQYGYTASAEDEGNVRFLRITDITNSGVNWSTVPFCECPPEVVEKYRLACGDIVFARIGATTGKSYLITNPPPSVFASYLIRVRAKREIDPTFLSQFFRSVAYWRQVNAQKNANLKKGVSGSLLKTLVVPVPPLLEQRKIAAVLGLVQRAIDEQERLIVLTTELKKALLHKLFTEGLRGEPQKQTEIGLVPESWEVVTLASLFEIKHGYAFEGEFFVAQGRYVLLTPGHFFEEGGFRDQKDKTKYYVGEIPRSYLLAKGDLLVAMTEQKAGLLGSAIIVPESEKFLHNQRLGLIVCRGSRTTCRFKSGAGNYRYTPLAKIRFWEATLRTEWIEKTFSEKESQTCRPYHQGTHRAS